ncbi:MAG: response regulator, partial [Fibrobacteraceae bacterium]
ERGVELFEKSVPGEYSAILMDIRMPGMDGYAATKLIRSMAHPDAQTVPVIAMTADAYDEDVKKCLAGGMVAHIAKPINRELLFETLSEFCR